MAENEQDLESLLDYLRRTRGFDFGSYKRTSLTRRIRRRMETVGVDAYGDYIDHLEVHPDEFAALFDTVLINVTSFFRDLEAWQALGDEVIPKLAGRSEPLRVWTAGCASGEEAFTVAMMLSEAFGEARLRDSVKIYATDVDERALQHARQGVYAPRDLEAVPDHLREKYFESVGIGFAFRGDIRRTIIFGRLDLLQDAPISKLDLLICRNTLIYFNAEAQRRVMARFHFALKEDGYLFLGRSEQLHTHSRLFTPFNARARIFTRSGGANLRERLLVLAQAGQEDAGAELSQQVHLREESFDSNPIAQIVLDAEGTLSLANAQARRLFRLTARDLGRPVQDLELSYRPIELRSRIEQAYATRSVVHVSDVEFRVGADMHHLEIAMVPLYNGLRTEPIGIIVSFTDVSVLHRARADLDRSAHELETAYEELQAAHEELETTNEELQSTIEELETTNEEVQSTNEELETMNEELQSTNEELQTMNEELGRRTEELNDANGYLRSIIGSMHAGVVVVDRNLTVKLWNERATDLWGLRPDEVADRSLLELDIGLPVEQLRRPARAVLEDGNAGHRMVLRAINRRGRTVDVNLTLERLHDGDDRPLGVIILMNEQPINGSAS